MLIGSVTPSYSRNCCGNQRPSFQVTGNKTSFGYKVSAKQSELLNYLKQKAPAHREFFGNQITKNMCKSNSSSFVRDIYLTMAITEAKVLKTIDKVAQKLGGLGANKTSVLNTSDKLVKNI